MPIEDDSRRGFLAGAGLVAGSLVGDEVLPATAEGQARPGGTPPSPVSKGARFRAAVAAGKPMMLPVVELPHGAAARTRGRGRDHARGFDRPRERAAIGRPRATARPRRSTSSSGAMYIALKEMKAKGGPFDDAANLRLPRELSAKLIDQETWLARAKKYGVVRP